jgi:YVTN family beta-propeller protein
MRAVLTKFKQELTPNMNIVNRSWLLALAPLAMSAASTAEPALSLAPAASIEIPRSTGAFDFLRIDAKRNRLLAAHEKDGTADYIDLQGNRLLARLKLGGAVDTAVDTDSKFYYVSVQDPGRVAVVDAETLKEVASVKTAGPTDAIIYEPKNHLVYVTHDDGTEVWVIDPAVRKVVATVNIPGAPEFMIYDESTDRIYLNIKDKNAVVVIDPAANKVVSQWSTLPAALPHGMALDVKNHRIFSAGGNGKLVVIDAKTGKVTDSIEIAPKVDQIALDAAGGIVYCAAPERMSVVRVVDGKLTPLGAVTTAATAKNVAVDQKTRAVWSTFTDGKSSFAKSWQPPKP